MRLVVGLGNFGDKYAYTYHNMGFLCAECLADKLGLKFKKSECDSSVAEGFVNGDKVVIARPKTFMNLSGKAVKQLLSKHGGTSDDLIVIYDDIDLPLGTLRIRPSGSAGTHNGMRNIIELLRTGEFKRYRIGIGPPPENVPLADYVLSDVYKPHRQPLFDAIEKAADDIIKVLRGD